MFLIIGILFGLACIIGGYVMHHGQVSVLNQPSEFIIIGGAGIGAFLASNSMSVVKRTLAMVLAVLKKSPFNKESYGELLQALYETFQTARKDSIISLEAHVEDPEKSTIFSKYPHFMANHHAVHFLCDTIKVMLSATVPPHRLEDVLNLSLETHHEESHAVPHAITRVAEAMPAIGIIAAVLGMIITMGSIGGDAAAIGMKVAAAMVGTFLGIMLCYCIFAPIAAAIEARIAEEGAYMNVIKVALLSFACEDSPSLSVEFARQAIHPEFRPSFSEAEEMTRKKG